MLNKLVAATAIAALAYAVSPADAARVKAGCSGDNLSKTETMIENMADGEGKMVAQKEIAAAQDAIDVALGHALEARYQEVVYPLSGVVLMNLDPVNGFAIARHATYTNR